MPISRELSTSVSVPTLEFIRTSGFTNEGAADNGERSERKLRHRRFLTCQGPSGQPILTGLCGDGINQRVEPPLPLPNLPVDSHSVEKFGSPAHIEVVFVAPLRQQHQDRYYIHDTMHDFRRRFLQYIYNVNVHVNNDVLVQAYCGVFISRMCLHAREEGTY